MYNISFYFVFPYPSHSQPPKQRKNSFHHSFPITRSTDPTSLVLSGPGTGVRLPKTDSVVTTGGHVCFRLTFISSLKGWNVFYVILQSK